MALPPGDSGWVGDADNTAPDQTVPEATKAPTRGWGQTAIDTGATIGQTLASGLRAGTTLGRDWAKDPHGTWAQFDRTLGDAEKWLDDLKSPRAKQIEQKKFFPGVDDDSAWSDLPAKVGSVAAGVVPFVAAALTPGPGWVGGAAAAGLGGSSEFGSYAGPLRDFFDRATPKEMADRGIKWDDALRGAGGDEIRARDALYNQAFDPTTGALTAIGGAVLGLGIAGRGAARGLAKFPSRVATGAVEGAITGQATGMAQQYGQERAAEQLGVPTEGSAGERIFMAGAETMLPASLMTGAMSVKGRPAPKTAIKVDEKNPVAPDQKAALDEALNAPERSVAPRPAPPQGELPLQQPARPPFDVTPNRPFTGYQPPEPAPGEAPFRGLDAQRAAAPGPLFDARGPLEIYADTPRPEAPEPQRLLEHNTRAGDDTYEAYLARTWPELGQAIPPADAAPDPVLPKTGRARKGSGVTSPVEGTPSVEGATSGVMNPNLFGEVDAPTAAEAVKATSKKRSKKETKAPDAATEAPEVTGMLDAYAQTLPVTPQVTPRIQGTLTAKAGPTGMAGLAAAEQRVARGQGETIEITGRRPYMGDQPMGGRNIGERIERVKAGFIDGVRKVQVERRNRVKPEDVRTPEKYNSWTGEKLSDEDFARQFLRDAGKTPKGEPAEPEFFASEDAKRRRWEAGLPLEWEPFVAEVRKAVDAGAETADQVETSIEGKNASVGTLFNSKGVPLTGRRLKQKLEREEQKMHRETLVQKAHEGEGKSGAARHNEMLKKAADDVGMNRGMAAARQEGSKDHSSASRRFTKAMEGDSRTQAEKRADPEALLATAREVQAYLAGQLERTKVAFDAAKAKARKRGTEIEGRRGHDIYVLPKAKRGRSGADQHPWFSRLARTRFYEEKLRNLIAEAKTGKNVTTDLKYMLGRWVEDSEPDVKGARETRKVKSAEQTEKFKSLKKTVFDDHEAAAEALAEAKVAKQRADEAAENVLDETESQVDRALREKAEDEALERAGLDPSEVTELTVQQRLERAEALRLDLDPDKLTLQQEKLVKENVRAAEAERVARATADPDLDPDNLKVEDEVLREKLSKTLERTEAEKERIAALEQQGARVPVRLAKGLLEADTINADTVENLLKGDANASGYRIAVTNHLNKRLANILRGLADEVPVRRDELLALVRRVENAPEGKTPVDAVQEIIDFVGPRDEARFASEKAQDEIATWLHARSIADDVLDKVDKAAPAGKTTPVIETAAAKRKKMTDAQAEAIARAKVPEPQIFPEREVTREVTKPTEPLPPVERAPDASERLARTTVESLVDPEADIEAVAARLAHPELVRVGTVNDVASTMTRSGDALDEAFRDVALEVVPDVKVVHLSNSMFNALMERLAPGMMDAGGYYDAISDRIFIRNAVETQGRDTYRSVLKHEVGHAMALAALERDAVARGKLEDIMSIARKNESLWRDLFDKNELARMRGILGDVHEFVSEVWANDQLKNLLATVPLKPGDAVKLQTPKARTVLEAFTTWVRKSLRKMFGKSAALNTALSESLIDTMTLFQGLAERGRPSLKEGDKTGAPHIGDWFKDVTSDTVASMKHRWNQRYSDDPASRGWASFGLWAHTYDDLAKRIADPTGKDGDWNRLAEKTRDVQAKIDKTRERIATDRDGKFLDFWAKRAQRPQSGKQSDFLIRETMLEAYADAPLGEKDAAGKATGKNKHVSTSSMRYYQVREQHAAMQKELADLIKADPSFARARKYAHAWGNTVRRGDLIAQLESYIGVETITKNANGSRNSTAESALIKRIMREAMTPAEKAWVDQQDKKVLNKLVAEYREAVPEVRKLSGPWVPLKRHGGYAVSGELNMPAVDTAAGREISKGQYEFYGEGAARDFIDKVNSTALRINGGSTPITPKMLYADRPVYEVQQGVPRDQWQKAEGITPARAANDPAYEVRERLRFNTKYFEGFEKSREGQARIEELKAAGMTLVRPTVELFQSATSSKNGALVTQAMQTLQNRLKKSAEWQRMSGAEKAAWDARLHTEAAKQVLAASGRLPGMPREYVEGASRDLVESYSEASAQSATNQAHAQHRPAMRDAIAELEDFNAKNVYNPRNELRGAITHEMIKRLFTVRDPFVEGIWGRTTNRLLQATYTAKLAGVSFLAINMTEPIIIGLPLLSGKYGAWKAFKEMKQAYADVGGMSLLKLGVEDFKNAFLNRKGKWADYEMTLEKNFASIRDPAERARVIALFKDLADKDLFDRNSVNEVTVLREPKAGAIGKALDWADTTFRGMNNAVEVMNRAVLALSAYRLEYARSGDDAKARRASETAVYEGAGQYSQWNAPPAFNHPVGRLAFQFKKYPQRIMGNYLRAVTGTLRGDTERAKQLAYMLGMQMMVAGAFGLPTEIFTLPINALNLASGGATPSSEDMGAEIYKFANELVGPEATEILAHGGFRAAGVDVSGRFGHDTLGTGGRPAGGKPQDIYTSAGSLLLGAPGSTGVQMIQGMQNTVKAAGEFSAGSYDRARQLGMQAVRDLIPVRGVADLFDAYKMSSGDGTARTRGGALMGPEASTGDIALRALGFRSAADARAGEARRVEKRATERGQEGRRLWLDRYAQALPSERPTIEAGIREFNDNNPRNMILAQDKVRAVASRRKETARPGSDLGLPSTSRTRELHRDLTERYMVGR